MVLAWHWKLVLVLGLSGCLVGCKSPVSGMFGGSGSSAGGQSAGSVPSASATNPVTKAWKSTTGAFASAFPAKAKTPASDEAISLSSKTGKLSANTRIATGRLLESRGELPKAQAEYEAAVKEEPTNLTALVSLARLQDRQGRPDQAIAAYQKALKAHPTSALVHNDLGLCYARKHDLASAVAMLHKAVEMEPAKPNYRNNLATVLVEAGRIDEALQQLQAVHAPAAAQYNLAYLLNHRGQGELARRHLAQAVQLDPTFLPAQEMLAQFDGGAAASQAGVTESPQIAVSQPAQPRGQIAPPAVGVAAQGGPYGQGDLPQTTLPQDEPATQTAEPVYHIGNEGVETSPAEGPSLYQPTSYGDPSAPPAHSPTSYHLEDSEDEEVLVVTHLVYGTDDDPAPEPQDLVDDDSLDAEETASEPADEPEPREPVNVKPVSKVEPVALQIVI